MLRDENQDIIPQLQEVIHHNEGVIMMGHQHRETGSI